MYETMAELLMMVEKINKNVDEYKRRKRKETIEVIQTLYSKCMSYNVPEL